MFCRGDVLQGVADGAVGSSEGGVQLLAGQPGAPLEQAQVRPPVMAEKGGKRVRGFRESPYQVLPMVPLNDHWSSKHYTSPYAWL